MAYIGIKNNKIKFYSDNEINKEVCNVDEVRFTNKKYMLSDDGTEYIPYNEETINKREIKKQIEQKENQYGMNRCQREMILAEGSGASDYNKQKAQEIENLAEQIRN